MKRAIFVGLAGIFFSFSSFAQTDPATEGLPAKVCKLDSIQFASGIQDRAPVGVSKVFGPSERKVFCWTKLSINRAPVNLKHIWYNGDQKVFELPLRLKYASGRLWSYKTITPGDWKVDVVNESGDVIGSGSFTAK
jgi:hypothetical protein